LFGTTKQNIWQHLKKILEDGEFLEESVVKNFFTTVEDGKNYKVKYYNLDAIRSVGYRVNSSKATQFRIHHDLFTYVILIRPHSVESLVHE